MSAAVYRLRDAAGSLLYIGSTLNVGARLHSHLNENPHPKFSVPGASEIRERFAECVTDYFDTLAQARAAERRAIEDEAPLLNRKHNPQRWQRHGQQWSPIEVTA